MTFGDPRTVSIHVSPKETIGTWIYGSFLLRLGDSTVGDENDAAVHLNGCINWLTKFVESPGDGCAPELMTESNNDIWQRLVVEPNENIELREAFSRFHISHIGMSSFNQVTLVLLNDGQNWERYVWQQRNDAIHDHWAPIGSLKETAQKAIVWYNAQVRPQSIL